MSKPNPSMIIFGSGAFGGQSDYKDGVLRNGIGVLIEENPESAFAFLP